MSVERKDKELRELTLDYFLIDRVREILNQDIDDHVKASLMCDLIKDEVERHISEAYDKGYEHGDEEGRENDEVMCALEEIYDIARGIL